MPKLVFVLIQLFLFSLMPATVSADSARDIIDRAPQAISRAGHIPEAIVDIEGPLIIVDKSAHTLYLFEGTRLVKSFKISTGKRRGNKWVRDDNKTPEGIYFLTEFLEDKALPAKYGRRAIVLDYPNPVDRFQGKTGYGIWVHGTNDPPRLERPYDSRGCVVMLNEDVMELSERTALLDTPVVIVNKMETVSSEEASMESKKVREWFEGNRGLKLDRVEGLIIVKHPYYLTVSFIDPDSPALNERRTMYLRETKEGYAVAADNFKARRVGKPNKFVKNGAKNPNRVQGSLRD